MQPGLARQLREAKDSGLVWVVAAFVVLSALNVGTLLLGPSRVLSSISSSGWRPLASALVFDTWGTVGGLLGVTVLFAPVLFGTSVDRRRSLSLFFVVASLLTGVVSLLLWDEFYALPGGTGAGSSSVAIAAQAVVFGLAVFSCIRLFRKDTRKLGPTSSYWWYSFLAIYLVLIGSTLVFVLVLQPVFGPTTLYNWRAHEFAFVLGVGAAVAYESTGMAGDFGRSIPVDEMLVNFHYDDLNYSFHPPLPKCRVAFGPEASFNTETMEVVIPESFRGKDYRSVGRDLDEAILSMMSKAGGSRPAVLGSEGLRSD